MIFEQLMPVLLCIWALGAVALLLRKEISWSWRISALLLLGFYAIWFRTELQAAYAALGADWSTQAWRFVDGIFRLLPVLLLLLWPLAVWMALFSRSPGFAHNLLRNLSLITLFYWLFWLLAYWNGMDPAQGIRALLPESLPLPALPAPPPSPSP